MSASTKIKESNQVSTPVIAFANHKGGCGKTTTAVNLAAELGARGYKVLLIDMDPQANASLHVGLTHPSEVDVGSAELLLGELELLPESIQDETTLPNVSLISGGLGLGYAEDRLREDLPRPSEELAYKLAPLMGLYSAIIIDCPPSLKLLSSNALSAATHVVIPIESGSQYGLYGVSDLIQHIQKIKRINPSLELLGAILIRHDARLTVSRLIKESAEELLGELIPVSIPVSTKANQAVILKQSISTLDPKSKIAKAFQAFAEFVETRLELSHLDTPEET